MPNNQVFTGADGSITLSTPSTAEGEQAQGVISSYELLTVGRVQNVKVEVLSDVKPFHEIGKRYATELRPGNITIQGVIGRAYVNGALLNLLLGEAATSLPAGSWVQPAFNITLQLENPAVAGVRNAVTFHDVKINNWVYTIPEDDFVLEEATFLARYLSVEDVEE